MGKERKSRSKINKTDFNLLKPLDLLKLGNNEDPCFGKYHDLLTTECRMCGDSEFCSVMMAQNMKLKILEREVEQSFKDIHEAELIKNQKVIDAKKLIKDCREKGFKRSKIIEAVWTGIKLPKEEIRKLL